MQPPKQQLHPTATTGRRHGSHPPQQNHDDSKSYILTSLQELGYSTFVIRGIQETLQQKCTGFSALDDQRSCFGYGGLEPYLASRIGTELNRALQEPSTSTFFEGSSSSSSSSSSPSSSPSSFTTQQDISYLSLYSFTLGSHPPLIRSVHLRRASLMDGFSAAATSSSRIDHTIEMDLDIDILLKDFSLVLGKNELMMMMTMTTLLVLCHVGWGEKTCHLLFVFWVF